MIGEDIALLLSVFLSYTHKEFQTEITLSLPLAHTLTVKDF